MDVTWYMVLSDTGFLLLAFTDLIQGIYIGLENKTWQK